MSTEQGMLLTLFIVVISLFGKSVYDFRKYKANKMKTLFGRITNVGFTGTQEGMSNKQRAAFTKVIKETKATHFHHGDCIGADADAHNIVRKLWPNPNDCRIVGHPPLNKNKRANCQFDFCLPPDEYLKRNHAIVNTCEVMIACPKEMEEELRSGTWATIRYTRKQGKRLIIIYGDGSIG